MKKKENRKRELKDKQNDVRKDEIIKIAVILTIKSAINLNIS